MSQYGWDDTTDADGYQEQDTSGGKGLRKQLEAQLEANKELKESLATLQKQMRAQTVQNTLRDLSIPKADKVAKLVPSDLADDPEKVKAWVQDFSDVLGLAPAGEAAAAETQTEAPVETPATPNLPPDVLAAMQRMQNADASSSASAPDRDGQILAQLAALKGAATATGGGAADAFFAGLKQLGANG